MPHTSLAVTDTHSLIWAATGNLKRLGKQARRYFEHADTGKCAIYVPTIVLVEISEACHAGRISLSRSFDEWVRMMFSTGAYHEIPLTAEVVYTANQLFAIPERGDRLIAATAIVKEVPLITRDPEIAAAASVECVW